MTETNMQPTNQIPPQSSGFAGVFLRLFGMAPEQVAQLQQQRAGLAADIARLTEARKHLEEAIAKEQKEFDEKRQKHEFELQKILDTAKVEADRTVAEGRFKAEQMMQHAQVEVKKEAGETIPEAARTVKS